MKTLIIILIIFFLLRLAGRYLFPYLLKRFIENFKKKFEAQQPQSNTSQNASKINIKQPAKDKFSDNETVEYTDFEEIKTNQNQQ